MVNTKLISLDLYPEDFEMLDEMMTATGERRNPLIRRAVKLLYTYPETWSVKPDARDNNTYLESSQDNDQPPAGTA